MHQKQKKKREWIRNLPNVRDKTACLEWREVEVNEIVWFE